VTARALLPSTVVHLAAAVADAQAGGRLPSLVAGVVRAGELAWAGSRGTAVEDSGRLQAGADTQYRIGSITKTFTAAMILQLRREGGLRLEDSAAAYVADAPIGDATLRSLLAHAGGLPAEPRGPWWERSPGTDFATLVLANADAERVLPAGEHYHYSNLAYAVLGRVVEEHRSMSWWQAAAHHLFEPLGMGRTTYGPVAPHADGYSVDALAPTLTREPHQDTGAMAPAGQLWSTLEDLAIWLGVLAGGRTDVLGPDELRAMTTVQSADPDEGLSGAYGLGLRLAGPGPRVLVGHTGSMPGFVCGAFVDPDTGVGAVVLGNGTYGLSPEELTRSLVETTLTHEPEVPAAWVPSTSVGPRIDELLGLWYWGSAAHLMTYETGALRLTTLASGRGFGLEAVGVDTFRGTSGYHTAETMRVVRDADGALSHLDIGTFCYTRVPYDERVDYPGKCDERP